MPVDDYILDRVENPGDVDAIADAVYRRLSEVFRPYIRQGTANIPNALEYVDIPAFVSDAELHLYATGLTVVATAATAFCRDNGVPLVIWFYDRDKEDYVSFRVM